jgi:histone-lysine N-methyltransferase SETD2
VAEKMFRKRMQAYAEEGIRHFYFMMLQKEEVSTALRRHSSPLRDIFRRC